MGSGGRKLNRHRTVGSLKAQRGLAQRNEEEVARQKSLLQRKEEDCKEARRHGQRHALQIICLVVSRGDEIALQRGRDRAVVYWLMNHTLAKEGAAHAAQLQEASQAQVAPCKPAREPDREPGPNRGT